MFFERRKSFAAEISRFVWRRRIESVMRLIGITTLTIAFLALAFSKATAQETPASASPSIEQRLTALESYLTNADPKTAEHISGPGHNAWMMTSAALVLFMTLPGLALFYGGLVRRKNVLSILAQCLGITGLVAILWWLFGYSFVFADGAGPVIGDFKKFAFLSGV